MRRGQLRKAPRSKRAQRARNGVDLITKAEFKWMANFIRQKADLPKGVRIRWILDPKLGDQGYDGMCDDHDSMDRFTISIATPMTASHCFLVLVHEIVHVRQRIFHPQEVKDHGPFFGKEYALLWRKLVGEE